MSKKKITGRPVLVGSKDMLEAFKQYACYQPSYPGLDLEEEGGITQISIDNLAKLVKKLGPFKAVQVGRGFHGGRFMFWWNDEIGKPCPSYSATGFGLGYNGEGSNGLARVISENFDLDFKKVKKVVVSMDSDFEGMVFIGSGHPDLGRSGLEERCEYCRGPKNAGCNCPELTT